MDAHITDIEPVTTSDILDMATWNRQRTTEELLSFIGMKHANLSDVDLGL